MRINFGRAAVAGVVGTAVMTGVGLYAAPMMGIPPMNPARMLAGVMAGNIALGWGAHFMIGIVLAVGYAAVGERLPGPTVLRGALYGIGPFLVLEIALMPMMGMPLFSGSIVVAMGGLLGHLVYGGIVGGIYGEADVPRVASAPA